MKIYVLTTAIFFYTTLVYSADDWNQLQVPIPQGKLLTRVHCVNANTTIVIGDSGTILRTSNNGANWSNTSFATTYTLNDIYFPDEMHGYIVGSYGLILRTTNAGVSWEKLTIASNDSAHSPNLLSVHFLDVNNGIAIGDAIVWQTNDGGNNWWCKHTVNGLIPTIYYMIRLIDIHTWLIGDTDGYFYKTTNDGNSWITYDSGVRSTDESAALYAFSFPEKNTIVAVGITGMCVRSVNAGETWSSPKQISTNTLYDVSFADSQNGTAVGDNGAIVVTSDGGQSWKSQTCNNKNLLFGVSCFGVNNAYASGANSTIVQKAVSGNTKVDEFSEMYASHNAIALYPNPSSQVLYCKLITKEIPSCIKFYDALGKIQLSYHFQNYASQCDIPVQLLPSGLYTAIVTNNNGAVVQSEYISVIH
ncbi:MAG: YCF48-related protein [Candidatus Kapaibacterium sp.]